MNFHVSANIGRLTNAAGEVTSYMADINVKCSECDEPFQFLGLPPGINTHGASMSIDGLEAHLAIAPNKATVSPLGSIAAYFQTGPSN